MKIGIIGAGGIGQAFAKQATKAGYEVIVSNSRGADSLKEIVSAIGGNLKAGTFEEALQADVTFLAVQWKHLESVVKADASWKDKIVIDPINPIITPGFQRAELSGRTSSEIVADLLAGARIVKAFNTYTPQLLESNPAEAGGRRVIFYSGDDEPAKKVVAEIIGKIGFAGVDLGSLAVGGKLQQFPGGSLPGLNLIQLP